MIDQPLGKDHLGYRVATLLDIAEVRSLRSELASVGDLSRPGFYVANVHGPHHQAVKVDALVKGCLTAPVRSLLPGLRPFLGTVITKGPGIDGDIDFHQDLTYTDERNDRAVLVWLALMDIDSDNGALRVVPGSHRWASGIRPVGGSMSTPDQDVVGPLAVSVPLRAGQALLYDPALLHGSGPNLGPDVRIAVASAFVPEGAGLFQFFANPEKGAGPRGFAVDDSYFTSEAFGREPIGHPRVAPWADAVQSADFDAALSVRVPK